MEVHSGAVVEDCGVHLAEFTEQQTFTLPERPEGGMHDICTWFTLPPVVLEVYDVQVSVWQVMSWLFTLTVMHPLASTLVSHCTIKLEPLDVGGVVSIPVMLTGIEEPEPSLALKQHTGRSSGHFKPCILLRHSVRSFSAMQTPFMKPIPEHDCTVSLVVLKYPKIFCAPPVIRKIIMNIMTTDMTISRVPIAFFFLCAKSIL
jgi:hypothetical protein